VEKKELSVSYTLFKTIDELPVIYQNLWEKACDARKNSHSPYSNFTVGAAIELESGKIITGVNQENASFPAGLCAERTAMYRAGAENPKDPFVRMVICASRRDSDKMESAPPCGGCRQVMLEFEKRFDKAFEIMFLNSDGHFVLMNGPKDLFPFSFVF
jgi:cytidine deaminase